MSTDHAKYGDKYLEEISNLKELLAAAKAREEGFVEVLNRTIDLSNEARVAELAAFNDAVNVAQARQTELEAELKLSITPCRLVSILNEQRGLFCDILAGLPIDAALRTNVIDGMHRVRCDHLHAKGVDPDDAITEKT